MKCVKRIAAAMFVMAVAIGCLAVSPMETQAAPKTTTNVFDSKNGVYYPTKVRVGINEQNETFDASLEKEGDYVSSVKSNSSNLIVKLTNKTVCTGKNRTSVYGDTVMDMKSKYTVECFAKKKGTYTVTFTIKDAKNKTVCKKKVKVYADEYPDGIQTFKYGGKAYESNFLTKKKSGKIQVKMNKGYKLQKIEVGTYIDKEYTDYDPKPTYRAVKNNSKITLATSSKYTGDVYNFSTGDNYSSKSYTVYDYIYPVTIVKVTYKDTKLGIIRTAQYEIFYQDK